MYHEERKLRQRGFKLIAGIDEAGRGPLAGPVVAAAVILPADYRNSRIDDSKKLTALERERLFVEIKNAALSYAVGIISPKEIDEIGILNTTKLAMRQAVLKVDPQHEFILIDAVAINIEGIPQMALIHGDAEVFSIAAASIVAKVTRDRLMAKAHRDYPQYGFDQHRGYGTEIHLEAIRKHGPCPIHRMTFAPLKTIRAQD
jgi:ribonuclease HII